MAEKNPPDLGKPIKRADDPFTPKFAVGDRVKAHGRCGEVLAVTTWAEEYPEQAAAQVLGRAKGRRAGLRDDKTVVLTVQCDGEARPRNVFQFDAKPENEGE